MNAATIEESSFKDFIQNQIESTNFNNETIKKSKLRNSDASCHCKDHGDSWKRYRNKKREKCPPDYW